MDMKISKSESGVSLGFAEALALLFIALKLCGVIEWPWLWVLSPIWISLGLVGLLALIVVIVSAMEKRRFR